MTLFIIVTVVIVCCFMVSSEYVRMILFYEPTCSCLGWDDLDL